MNWPKRLLIGTLISVCIVLVIAGSTFATTAYSGNARFNGYGCKASIWTPATLQYIEQGIGLDWVGNKDQSYGDSRWVQAGIAQGDGVSRMANGVLLPTVPSSYKEINKPNPGYYYFQLYSAQPLNYARVYEVVNYQPNWWKIIIAGTDRGGYQYFANLCPVFGLGEIQSVSGTLPPNWAHFDNVSYKGQSTYFLFDQDQRWQDYPLTYYSASHYTAHNGY